MRNDRAPWVRNKLDTLESKVDAIHADVAVIMAKVDRNAADIRDIRRTAWKLGAFALTLAGSVAGVIELMK